MASQDCYAGSRIRAFMALPNPVSLTAKWTHRRAGFTFGKEPIELPFTDLGGDRAAALESLLAIASDTALRVVLVQADGCEIVLNDGEGVPSKSTLDAVAADLAEARRAGATASS